MRLFIIIRVMSGVEIVEYLMKGLVIIFVEKIVLN